MVPTAKQLTESLVIMSERYGEQKAVNLVMTFIHKNHLTHFIPSIQAILKKRELKIERESIFSIVSATDINESTKDRLSDMVHQKTGEIPKKTEVTIDKTLIGGFIGTYKGNIFDGSVRTVLNSLLNKK